MIKELDTYELPDYLPVENNAIEMPSNSFQILS